MDVKSVVNEILEALSDLGSAERREKSLTYFPTAQKVMGVKSPDLKAILKEIRSKQMAITINICERIKGVMRYFIKPGKLSGKCE